MGKVRDEAPAAKSAKPTSRGATGRGRSSELIRFFANLGRTDVYKPSQGWRARLWTAIGLGALVLAGVYSLYQNRLDELPNPVMRLAIPAALIAGFGWCLFRTIQYQPFADFLIATEAEMNKVSWTTWPELKRATLVVITTVLLLSVYLFGVDLLWQYLLKLLGVLRFASSHFGSQAS